MMILQQKFIHNLYLQNYKTTQKNVSKLSLNKDEKVSLSDKTKLKLLSKGIKQSCSKISNSVEEDLLNDITELCNEIFDEFEAESGIEIKDKDEFIANVISSIVLGLIYNTDWNLSDALDKASQNLTETVIEIIENGIAAGKSEAEIVEAVLKAVDPNSVPHTYTAKHKTLYVGKPYSGIERIARTTLEHSLQKAVVDIAKEASNILNAKVMVRWISVLAPNTCEVCESRHNKLYEPDDVPLEHPNGQCEFQIEIL